MENINNNENQVSKNKTSFFSGRRIFLCFLILVLGGFLFFFNLVRLMIVPPAKVEREFKLPAGSESFSVTNPEGHRIPAWFYKGEENRGTVVLCHGHGVDHRYMDNVLLIFLKMKLGVIFCDFRAHGKADGYFTSIGKEEWKDLKAVIDKAFEEGYLKANQPIVAYGRSMGAALLANGSAQLPQIKGFILESCFSELRKIAGRDAKRVVGLPDCAIIDVVFYLSQMVSGYDYFGNKPIESITGVASRPLLFIHDELDPRATTEDFERFCKKMPTAKTLIVPGAGHVMAYDTAPVEFENKVREILVECGLNPEK
ncbi:MAG: alpha/beta hydrolase [Candidatus Riflebacteria bacterium]|nr:alpha/beta hydrolase [Candidatus Riflebacteria bacterium]